MGAAEHQGINAFVLQGMQIAADNHLGLPLVEPPFLHQRHQQGTGLGKDLCLLPGLQYLFLINIALDGRSGADDADAAVGRHGKRLLDGRADHFKNRHIEFLFQQISGRACRGITGYDDDLRAFVQKKFGILSGILANGFRTFRAIRGSRQITEINETLPRQQLLHRFGDSHAADT